MSCWKRNIMNFKVIKIFYNNHLIYVTRIHFIFIKTDVLWTSLNIINDVQLKNIEFYFCYLTLAPITTIISKADIINSNLLKMIWIFFVVHYKKCIHLTYYNMTTMTSSILCNDIINMSVYRGIKSRSSNMLSMKFCSHFARIRMKTRYEKYLKCITHTFEF